MNRHRKLKQGASYEVRTLINRDEIIFDDACSALFLKTVERCKKKYDFQVKNFTVIEHYVLLILTPCENSPLPKIMQWINSVFAKAYNKLKGFSGHVWKERYASKIIETVKEFIEIFENIVRKPIEANLVENAREYQHSGLYHYQHKLKSIISDDAITKHLYEYCKDFRN